MSKALKTAAIIVGVAALTVATLGLAFPATFGAAATAFTISGTAVTFGALTTALTLTASALSIAAGIMAKKPSFSSVSSGTQLDFLADPSAGQPYVMGNARVGEQIVHQASWGDKNKFLGIVGVLCCAGPIMAYDGLYADNTLTAFSGGPPGNATGYYANFMYHDTKLGARPDTALTMTVASLAMPNWGTSHKLSSLAASGLILVADLEDGKFYSGGVPKFTHQIRGVLAYDARADSTNGGTGTQRPGGSAQAETAYAYSENPWVHHGTFALGRWVNGKKVIGPGLPAASIDWASHREAANIADTNLWKVSGRILSTDRKWEALKAIAQAGGGYPIPTGAKLAALINTPRVSLETINEEDLKGPVSAPQMSMRRDRLNGAIARFRSPDHAYEIVSSDPVRNATWLTEDGNNPRTREIDLPLVANKAQAAQLVAYEVANSRERAPISLELDLYWSQYKMGDCLTLNLPSALLTNQKAVIISRTVNPESNTVTFEFRTEDDTKHSWALGQTGTAPPATDVGSAPGTGDTGGIPPAQPAAGDFAFAATTAQMDSGPVAAVEFSGAATQTVDWIKFRYRTYDPAQGADDNWVDLGVSAGDTTYKRFTHLAQGTQHEGSIRYGNGDNVAWGSRRILGPVTTPILNADDGTSITPDPDLNTVTPDPATGGIGVGAAGGSWTGGAGGEVKPVLQ